MILTDIKKKAIQQLLTLTLEQQEQINSRKKLLEKELPSTSSAEEAVVAASSSMKKHVRMEQDTYRIRALTPFPNSQYKAIVIGMAAIKKCI